MLDDGFVVVIDEKSITKENRNERSNSDFCGGAPIPVRFHRFTMYGGNACRYGGRFNFRSKEGEAERRSHDQHWIEEDVRQGEEVFLSFYGDRLH